MNQKETPFYIIIKKQYITKLKLLVYVKLWCSTRKIQARQKAVRTAEIKARLTEIDFESIRPLRAKAAGNPSEKELTKLSALEAEAVTLREELETLK